MLMPILYLRLVEEPSPFPLCIISVAERVLLNYRRTVRDLTFRHRASRILGQAFRYSPVNAFYIFNQQIYFII